jgi:malate dehydrogenase (oxaloacetate-decarboxylating)
VATDSEGILGIGDQGVGGIDIAIGKLAVYIAAAGLHPRRVIPVVLDMGTDNLRLLNDDMYIGNRHGPGAGPALRRPDRRLRHGGEQVVPARHVALGGLWRQQRPAHLEQVHIGCVHVKRRYARDRPVVLAAAFAAAKATGSRMRDQRVVIHGAGTAGIGVADMMREVMIKEGLSEQEAASRFWTVDSRGLLTDDSAALRDFQSRTPERRLRL